MAANEHAIGVVGCGARMQALFRAAAQCQVPLRVQAVCDPDAKALEHFRNAYAPEAKVYADYRDLVLEPNVQWVAVGTWNSLHAAVVTAAIGAGKHVFCEKPIATNTADCLALYQAWRKAQVRMMIGFTLRYTSFCRQLKALISQGAIGRVVSLEFNETLNFNHGGHIMCCWRRQRQYTGSHILEKCCHDIDMANWLVESRPARVASFGGLNFFVPKNAPRLVDLQKSKDGATPYCSWPTAQGRNPFTTGKDIIDNQVSIIEYENAVRATFHTNLNAGIPERRMYLLGSIGAIRADFVSGRIELRKIGFDEESSLIEHEHADGHGGGDQVLVAYWDKMMREGAPSLTDIRSGIEAAIGCFALDEAMLTGSVVDLRPIWRQLASET